MHPFLVGFLITFLILFAALLLLRITVPYASKLFGSIPIPYKSFKESTDWLNFILFRVMTHFQTEESRERINEIVSKNLKIAKFNIRSLGKSPEIPYVATLKVKDENDIKLLIPIVWENGPSVDVSLLDENIVFEADIDVFKGSLLISWPADKEIDIEIRFVGEAIFDFSACVLLMKKFRISISELPLIGPILKGIVPFIITKRSIRFKADIIPPNIE